MDEVTMLQVLNEYGEDAASDYNDGEDVMGWFGWSINDEHILTVTFRDEDGEPDSAQWRLVPIP
jgi:hypothetical protein